MLPAPTDPLQQRCQRRSQVRTQQVLGKLFLAQVFQPQSPAYGLYVSLLGLGDGLLVPEGLLLQPARFAAQLCQFLRSCVRSAATRGYTWTACNGSRVVWAICRS